MANKFRNDGLIQIPSGDLTSPNMDGGKVIKGVVKFIYGDSLDKLEILRNSKLYKDLQFDIPQKTKELRLTHKLNSEKAGFSKLFELYRYDLFIKLVDSVKKKIKSGTLNASGKSFEELAEKTQTVLRKSGPLVVGEIKYNPELLAFYDEVKTYSLEEVISKSKINKDSLLSYKFNGLSSRYESGTDRDRIIKKLDLIYELLELYKTGRHNEFLRITKFKLTSSKDQISLSKVMTEISADVITIGEVIELVEESGLISQDDLFKEYIENRGYYLWS